MSEVRRSFGFPLSIAVVSDVGRVRANNEDAFGHAWLPDGSLFVIVADGMGGHEAGEVASGLAVRVVEDVVSRDLGIDPRERLYGALLEANDAILAEGGRTGTQGMGTTAVTALVQGNSVHVGLIGDSRCYHLRKGHALWRTLDHTRVQLLLDHGEIDDAQARHHPEAGMLTRALGHARMADGRPLVPDVLAEPLFLEEGDALVLSSDGLHDLAEDWEIARASAGRTADEAAERLVELACERGGHDNVTVAVVIAGARASAHDASYVPTACAEPPGRPSVHTDVEPTVPGAIVDRETSSQVLGPGPVSYASGVASGVAAAMPPQRRGGSGWMLGMALALVLGGVAVLGLVVLVAVAVGMNWL